MKIVSVNVGKPRTVEWQGRQVQTSIWKNPVEGRVRIDKLNLAGDQQSDLTVHGGVDKAVYAYPAEHYPFWRRELAETELAWGTFGENLTIAGLLEDGVRIGDVLRIGTAELVVTQPRMPCFKLGIRLARPDIIKRFLQSGRTGFYFSVQREGEVAAGDPIEFLVRADASVTVAEVVALYVGDLADAELLARASQLPTLPRSWREHFRKLMS